jgi:DNA-binding SARP family transcriptional activator
MRCLKDNGYRHFFGWNPTVMQAVLSAAVANDVEADYARTLASARLGTALLPGGRPVPLLRVVTLGRFKLRLEEHRVNAEDLTPTMRELLALLISSPERKMYQEEVLALLWPDTPAVRARGRLDTLLLELRRVLKAAFGDNGSLDHYLAMRKGLLCLSNCRLDAELFAGLARKGLAHARNREFWQAGNSFHSAFLHWQGPYLAGMRSKDLVSNRGYELERLYLEMALVWGRILLDEGHYGDCIDLVDRALRSDGTNDALVSLLYRAYLRSNQPVRANALLRRYEEALRDAEYDDEEISDLLREIWNVRDALAGSTALRQ